MAAILSRPQCVNIPRPPITPNLSLHYTELRRLEKQSNNHCSHKEPSKLLTTNPWLSDWWMYHTEGQYYGEISHGIASLCKLQCDTTNKTITVLHTVNFPRPHIPLDPSLPYTELRLLVNRRWKNQMGNPMIYPLLYRIMVIIPNFSKPHWYKIYGSIIHWQRPDREKQLLSSESYFIYARSTNLS